MIMLDAIILESLMTKSLKAKLEFGNTVPLVKDIYSQTQDDVNGFFDPRNIPYIPYSSVTSAKIFSDQIDKITLWLGSTNAALKYVLADHEALAKRYMVICERINNEMTVFKEDMSSIMNYSCHNIFSLSSKQRPESNIGRIGNFITLPYFLESCKMFNGSLFLRGASTGTILFSNIENVSSIPMSNLPSIKILDQSSNINITITCSFSEMEVNAVYAKFYNENIIVTLSIYGSNNTLLYNGKMSSSGVLFNFSKIKATNLVFNISAVNTNQAKPYSLQMSKLEIFNEIIFAKFGSFVSTSYEIGEVDTINTLNLTHNNLGDINKTNSIQYLSVQTAEDDINFSRVEQDDRIDISSYKYKYSVNMYGFSRTLDSNTDIYGHRFYKLPIPKSNPTLWNIDIANAIIYAGINRSYTTNVGSIDNATNPYENWTKVGNYYKTMVANYENNIQIDFGNKIGIVNGRNITGLFTMPMGISSVEIHTKDIDFKFGQRIENDKYNGIKYPDIVSLDPLYPSNMAYVIGGMPEYDGAELTTRMTEKEFYASGTSAVFLNEPFIPASINVFDSNGRLLTMVISKAPSIPGTFSIEPNKGVVRICPNSPDMFKITYRRCSTGRKPAGILFNRLLTFMPMKSMVNMLKYNSTDANLFETYFTLDGNQDNRYIMIPEVIYAPQRNMFNAILSYNLKTDSIYSSVKIDLTSNDKHLTPIVNNIYVTGR